MIKLNDDFKITTAKALTELAIQNELIYKYNDEEKTAKAVCTFFKTIFDELDSNAETEK